MFANNYTCLSLGDSYTIGESVPLHESFSYQTIQALRKSGHAFYAAEIIAKTGWTTAELQAGIRATQLLNSYDFVSLLIGVNNQYRGESIEAYKMEFEALLQQAIGFANNKPQHVFVLSIPDWGVTPFAEGRNRSVISKEIDAFNNINRAVTEKYKANYIDITPGTRQAAIDNSLLAADQLHYSGKEHARWASQLTEGILTKL